MAVEASYHETTTYELAANVNHQVSDLKRVQNSVHNEFPVFSLSLSPSLLPLTRIFFVFDFPAQLNIGDNAIQQPQPPNQQSRRSHGQGAAG